MPDEGKEGHPWTKCGVGVWLMILGSLLTMSNQLMSACPCDVLIAFDGLTMAHNVTAEIRVVKTVFKCCGELTGRVAGQAVQTRRMVHET